MEQDLEGTCSLVDLVKNARLGGANLEGTSLALGVDVTNLLTLRFPTLLQLLPYSCIARHCYISGGNRSQLSISFTFLAHGSGTKVC